MICTRTANQVTQDAFRASWPSSAVCNNLRNNLSQVPSYTLAGIPNLRLVIPFPGRFTPVVPNVKDSLN